MRVSLKQNCFSAASAGAHQFIVTLFKLAYTFGVILVTGNAYFWASRSPLYEPCLSGIVLIHVVLNSPGVVVNV